MTDYAQHDALYDAQAVRDELERRVLSEMQRRKARTSLADFTLYTYKGYLMGWFHKQICETLDQFLADIMDKKRPRLILCAPPRSGKSEITSRRFPAYALGRYPDLQIIATSYSADLAQRFNRDVQRIIDDDVYRNVFPDTTLNGTNVRTTSRGSYIRTSDLFEIVNHHGAYRSCGVGGGITGMGADCLIIDDPIKDRASANSQTIRSNLFEWYTSTAYTRLSDRGGVIVMCTRWHPIKDSTPVLTTMGWKTHGQLDSGDYVLGLSGKPVRVTHVGEPVRCNVKVTTLLADSLEPDYVVCGPKHLWPLKHGADGIQNVEAQKLLGKTCELVDGRHVVFSRASRLESGLGRCITTDAPDGIYLVGRSLMPTHNCDDLVGRLIDRMKTDEDADQWTIINYPAIAEYYEQHRKTGEALHPDRFPLEVLNKIRSNVGERDWAALYQQHPVPDGGGLFKDVWVQYYKDADLPKSFDKTVISWDMTFKDSQTSDYVVGQVWGRKGANFYLLDQVRGQMDFVHTVEAFVALAKKWPRVVRKLVEDKANGPAIISMLRNKVSGIIPVTPKESKEARASAITTLWEAHNVYLPDPNVHTWVAREFVPELLSFPSAAHDDQVDAMTQALNDLKTASLLIDPTNIDYLSLGV